MPATLKPAPVSTRQLTYDPARRTFTGEISSTNGLGRVYADACDDGLTLVSTRTGAELVFVVQHVEYDREGDLMLWELTSVDGLFFMTIFND
jgi:hypothetical protein